MRLIIGAFALRRPDHARGPGHPPHRAPHDGLQPGYAKKLYQRLSDADKIGGKEEVLNELERVRREMEQGLFKDHL